MSSYTVEANYDRKELDSVMDLWHAQRPPGEQHRSFDFTLATEWGEAWSNAEEGSTCRYRLLRDGKVAGVFQGLIRTKYFYSYMTAGLTGANGLAIISDQLSKDSEIFLREILNRERRLSNYSIFANLAPTLPGVIVAQSHTFHIDLTKPLDQIRLSMRKGTRWAIEKAQKNDVNIDVLHSTRALRQTYELVAANSRQKGFLIPSLNWLENLHDQFSNCGDSVSVLASSEGNLLSAAYFLGFDGKMNWIMAGSTSAGNRKQAGNLVQMRIIEWAKTHGYGIYNMGGTNPSEPIYAGIHAFKSGFGGELVSNVCLRKKSLFQPLVLKLYAIYRRREMSNSLAALATRI